MSIVIQLANIGPIAYSVLRSFWPHRFGKEAPFIYSLMVVGVVSSLLLAFFWDATSMIGKETCLIM